MRILFSKVSALLGLCVFSGAAIAGIDLESLRLETHCAKQEAKFVSFNRDQRSIDVVCNVSAPKALVDHKLKRNFSKPLDSKKYVGQFGYHFLGIPGSTPIINGGEESEAVYQEVLVDGKVIGHRGVMTIKDKKGLKVILGAYFTLDAENKIKDLAKIYVLDRSTRDVADVPSDLEAALKEFDSRVRPSDSQGAWVLTAEVVRLPGKDLQYGTLQILLDLAKNLGNPDTSVYDLDFKQLRSVKNPAQFVHALDEEGNAGAFCENLLENGKPLDPDSEDQKAYGKACERLTNDLIAAVAKTSKGSKYLLQSAFDEETRGYLLLPSKEEQDQYLKIYFDVSHNE